jgi:predicted AAA+ superfamily ATPase
MRKIDIGEIRGRLGRDNPWWTDAACEIVEAGFPRRAYFDSFKSLALNTAVRRATVLLGPRRVGKTVMAKQLIREAIDDGFKPGSILYASIDTPIYFGLSLEKLLNFFANPAQGEHLVVFDEIQYLPGWEVHLKDLVDRYPRIKFVVTGSAAASLRLKSKESGAGRFSEFMLPPLTFHEFLRFTQEDHLVRPRDSQDTDWRFAAEDINRLNDRFIDYLNYGGYPEAVLNPAIRDDPERFLRNDIIDKVLLKDLPNLYGIDNIPELNRLFAVLAYNTGNEASLENLAREAEMSKQTIKRYIQYLESAFLIIKLSPIDQNCKSYKRERNFKVYLNNPSMRSALFGPVRTDQPEQLGHLAEAAIISQWQHASDFRQLRYARWKNQGEVDIVYLDPTRQRPAWMIEVKWSDRVATDAPTVTKSMRTLWTKNRKIERATMTTRTIDSEIEIDGRRIDLLPSALYCYSVGRNLTASMGNRLRDPIDLDVLKP